MINKKSQDKDTEKDTDLSYLFGILSYPFQKIQNTGSPGNRPELGRPWPGSFLTGNW